MKNLKSLLHALLIFIGLLSLNAQAGVEITYIHNDALGSPVAGTDEQGNVKWRSHYQPYGEELLGERQMFGVRTGYTGHRDDPETGLTYMGARYYSPTLGRFMGVDPAGVSESNLHSFNRYAYANNNPYKYVDPDGESPLDIGFLLVDSVKLAIAIQSGVGVGAAFGDFAASVAGVASPVPGLGLAIKAKRAAGPLKKAQDALGDSLSSIANRSKNKTPATAVAGTSTETGLTAAGQSAKGCGGKRCAELDVAAQVGGDPKNIVFTKPVRPRTGEVVPVCKDCQKVFDRNQFPKGTTFE